MQQPGSHRPQKLEDIVLTEESRIVTGVNEFDRVMGGGIMQGSFVLIAGDPGIGKSTLMTELGKYLPTQKYPLRYGRGISEAGETTGTTARR